MTEESDKLDFLNETADAPEPEQQPEPQAEATGAQEAPPPVAAEEIAKTIPITALLDEREKRQAAERKAEEAERRWQDVQRQIAQAQQPRKPTDWFEKPDQAMQERIAPVQMEILSTKLDTSELIAATQYGAETVETAKAAFLQEVQKDPSLHQRVLQSRHPYDEVVKWHKRQAFMSQIGNDPDAYINARVEELLQQRLSTVQTPPAHNSAPPPSLSKAPAAGSGEKSKPGSAFDALPIR